jgi:hypothetical protein
MAAFCFSTLAKAQKVRTRANALTFERFNSLMHSLERDHPRIVISPMSCHEGAVGIYKRVNDPATAVIKPDTAAPEGFSRPSTLATKKNGHAAIGFLPGPSVSS